VLSAASSQAAATSCSHKLQPQAAATSCSHKQQPQAAAASSSHKLQPSALELQPRVSDLLDDDGAEPLPGEKRLQRLPAPKTEGRRRAQAHLRCEAWGHSSALAQHATAETAETIPTTATADGGHGRVLGPNSAASRSPWPRAAGPKVAPAHLHRARAWAVAAPGAGAAAASAGLRWRRRRRLSGGPRGRPLAPAARADTLAIAAAAVAIVDDGPQEARCEVRLATAEDVFDVVRHARRRRRRRR